MTARGDKAMETEGIAGCPGQAFRLKRPGGRIKEMDGMLQTVASIASLLGNARLKDIPRGIEYALEAVGSRGKGDRCALYLLSEDGLALNRTHAWVAKGAATPPAGSGELRMKDFPWIMKCLERREPVCLTLRGGGECGPDTGVDLLEVLNARALLLVPMAHGGKPLGFMGIESTVSFGAWDDGPVMLFRAASGMLAGACVRMRVEEDLASCRQRLRKLSHELALAEEKERRLIASDIHDRIGHGLTVACMKLKRLEKGVPRETRTAVREVTGLVGDLIREANTLTFSISPPILYDFGLGAAVEWLVEETRREHGLEVTLSCSIEEDSIDSPSRFLAYQAIRELLFNVVKHARAGHAFLSITEAGGNLRTVIEDDGRGFVLHERARGEKPGGFGLFNIRERLGLVGGALTVGPRPGGGSRITMVAPVSGGEPAGETAVRGPSGRGPQGAP